MKNLILITLSIFPLILLGQGSLVVPTTSLDINPSPRGMLNSFNLVDRDEDLKESYLEDDWRMAKIELVRGRKINDYPVKISLDNHNVEIKVDEKIKILPYEGIERIFLANPLLGNLDEYVPCQDYIPNDLVLKGFFKVRKKGSWSLFEYTKIEYTESYYLEALDMGTNETNAVKQVNYYIFGANELFEVPKSRKKLIQHFEEWVGLKKFMRENNLVTTDVNDLENIVGYINDNIK